MPGVLCQIFPHHKGDSPFCLKKGVVGPVKICAGIALTENGLPTGASQTNFSSLQLKDSAFPIGGQKEMKVCLSFLKDSEGSSGGQRQDFHSLLSRPTLNSTLLQLHFHTHSALQLTMSCTLCSSLLHYTAPEKGSRSEDDKSLAALDIRYWFYDTSEELLA